MKQTIVRKRNQRILHVATPRKPEDKVEKVWPWKITRGNRSQRYILQVGEN